MLAAAVIAPRPVREYLAALGAAVTLAGAVGLVLLREPGAYQSLLLMAFGLVAAAIVASDIRTLRAPNAIVYPAAATLALLALPLGVENTAEALAGGALAFVALLAVALAGRGAMGLGDVKAGSLCGISVGLNGVILMLASAFVAGGLVAAFALVLRVRGRKDVVAFTPFLVFGSFVALALGNGYLVR